MAQIVPHTEIVTEAISFWITGPTLHEPPVGDAASFFF
jgi:hypothetical protein